MCDNFSWRRFSVALMTVVAVGMGMVSCSDNDNNNLQQSGNNIVVNKDKQWEKCDITTSIGDISALPQEMQSVMRELFTNQGQRETSRILIVGKDELTEQQKAAYLQDGRFVVTVGGEENGMAVLLQCMVGEGTPDIFVMYDELEQQMDNSEHASSMTDEEWEELRKKVESEGEDKADAPVVTDYDNDPDRNANYYHTRMEPFISWIKEEVHTLSLSGSDNSNYENMMANIDLDGQRLHYSYWFTLNNFIDKYNPSGTENWLCKSGSIEVEYRIYPIHIFESNGKDKAGDYYGVTCSVTPHNNSMWGPYTNTHFWSKIRIYGYWFKDLDIESTLLNADGSTIEGLEYELLPLPENVNDSRSYSNGKTFSINGSFSGGTSGGHAYAVGQFALGGSWTSSTNYTLETISFTRDSSNPNTAKYRYYSTNVTLTDDWDNMDRYFPVACHSEFTGHTMWIWHVPYGQSADNAIKNFKLRSKITANYSSWYHWRSAIEYDSNRKDYKVNVPEEIMQVEAPGRTPFGMLSLRNVTSNKMAHVRFFNENGEEIEMLSDAYGTDQAALIALPVGTYSVTYDIVDGNNNTVLKRQKIENITLHQGKDKESATTYRTTIDGQDF